MHRIYRDNTLNATREGLPITLVPLMGQVYMFHVLSYVMRRGIFVLMCLKYYPLAELR